MDDEGRAALAFDAAKDAPKSECHVCGDSDCRRPIVGCARCGENMHEWGCDVCMGCDVKESQRGRAEDGRGLEWDRTEGAWVVS